MRRFGPGGNPYRRRAISRLERRRPTPGDPGRRHRPTPATVVELEPEGDDALERLLEMGFRVSEVKRPLALARAEGDPDPVRFVLGHLIQGRAKR